MLDEIKDRETDGCTFKPQINAYPEGEKKRSVNRFLEDQQKFLERKRNNTENLKQQISQQNASTMQPSIDETSRKIIEGKATERSSKPTYERLYDMNRDKQ